jgi:mannose-6-phosphate isomerase
MAERRGKGLQIPLHGFKSRFHLHDEEHDLRNGNTLMPMTSEYLEGPERPWGRYQVLADTPTYKVKTIWVEPGHRLSLQRHQKREEHWYIVSGVADVVLGDKEFKVSAGDSVEVAIGEQHRIGNSGSEVMIFIEVQRGTYFGEDDIERIQDDYAR